MNIRQNNVSFSATYVPFKQNKSFDKVIESIEPYFELRGFGISKAESIRNKISLSQAGIGLNEEGLVLVGKDREADEFISRMIDKNNVKSKYVEDTPVTDFKDGVIDLLI